MAKKGGSTYQLHLSDAAFAIVTRGLMVHSRNCRKLRGFGQFMSDLLREGPCSYGRTTPKEALNPVSLASLEGSTIIYLAIEPDTLEKLREAREHYTRRAGAKVETRETIVLLIQEFLANHHSDADLSLPSRH